MLKLNFNLIFVASLFVIFIFEGLGLPNGREVSFYLTLFLALITSIHLIIRKSFKIIPKSVIMIVVVFTTFLFFSTFNSVNFTQSLRYFFYYLSLVLIFLLTLSEPNIKKPLLNLILVLGVIFSIYSLVIDLNLEFRTFYLIPDSGYQFVYSKFGSHNHLGDFLSLSLLTSFYLWLKTKQKKFIHLFIFFIPFFMFSFSRSAYLSFAIAFFLLVKELNIKKKFLYATSSFVVFLILASFLVVTEINKIPLLSNLNQTLSANFNLKPKLLFAGRPEYFRQAIASFSERPLFGLGPGNFVYGSIKFTNLKSRWTFSSHNIFLDFLAEDGLLTFLAFLTLIIIALNKFQRSIFYFLFLNMLINFQTDYTHTIFSYLMLFFILMGVVYNPSRKDDKHLFKNSGF